MSTEESATETSAAGTFGDTYEILIKSFIAVVSVGYIYPILERMIFSDNSSKVREKFKFFTRSIMNFWKPNVDRPMRSVIASSDTDTDVALDGQE